MIRRTGLFAAAAISLLVAHTNAFATVVVPGGFDSVAGDSGNCIPFGGCDADENRYEQVYDAAGFGGASGNIDSIAFRLDIDPTIPNNSVNNLSLDLLVSLSYTTANSQSVSLNFADNTAIATQQVFSGTVNWTATQSGNPIDPFDLGIQFDTPFFFDGQQNLLLDITVLNSDSIFGQLGQLFYLDAADNGPFGRAFGPADSTGTGFNPSYGLVTAFDFEPATTAVPEPPMVSLVLAGLVAVLASIRRRRGALLR